jgi:phosphate transport system substrate-binding protein
MKFSFQSLIVLVFIASAGHAQSVSVGSEPLASANTDVSKEATAGSAKIEKEKAVIITGVRFAYPLLQKWIDDYTNANPSAQIIIESRGSADPAQYDILAEVYDQPEEIKKTRDYLRVGRYAVLPVANSKSSFAKIYTDKGLNKDLITQLFFHNLFSDKKELEIKAPFTIYTRLQKAGAPIVFTRYFGFEQKDVKGKAIAGADEHLLKALLRDTTGVSYLPLTLIYDHTTKKPAEGLTVLPLDFNGNGRVSDDEKFYGDLNSVITRLEESEAKSIHNIPVEALHLSVDKNNVSPEALAFLTWVVAHSQESLHDFGYLKPEQGVLEKDFQKFKQTSN